MILALSLDVSVRFLLISLCLNPVSLSLSLSLREEEREKKRLKTEEKKEEKKRKAQEKKDHKEPKEKKSKRQKQVGKDGEGDHRVLQRRRGAGTGFDETDPMVLQMGNALPPECRVRPCSTMKEFLDNVIRNKCSILLLKKGAVRKVCQASLIEKSKSDEAEASQFINATCKGFSMIQSNMAQSAHQMQGSETIRKSVIHAMTPDCAKILGFDFLVRGQVDHGGAGPWVMDREKFVELLSKCESMAQSFCPQVWKGSIYLKLAES